MIEYSIKKSFNKYVKWSPKTLSNEDNTNDKTTVICVLIILNI